MAKASVVYRNGWSPAVIVVALLTVFLGVMATLDAWLDIFHIASQDEEASQVFLVLPVAAWLIWVRRGRFRYCRPNGSLLGPMLVALGWASSTIGYRFETQAMWHGGAVLVVVGCLVSVLGRNILLRFLPAFLVLVFLVPIPGMLRQKIAIPLQKANAVVTEGLFELAGIPVDRTGNVISINGQSVAIAEACNGMRMVFTLALVSYAFAFGEPLRNYVRLLILAASPLSAIVCNVIRMIPTLWLYGFGSQEWADWFHDVAGWIMLGVAFLILMSIDRLLRWAMIPVAHYTLASE
jgi:exosortase